MIEKQQEIPGEILKMPLSELRKQLIQIGSAYKGEKIRNQEFQKKLDGAIRQLDRREDVEK